MKLAMILLKPLFPFNPAIDTTLEHRHLIAAYVVVLAVQIVYFCYSFRRLRIARRSHSEAQMRKLG